MRLRIKCGHVHLWVTEWGGVINGRAVWGIWLNTFYCWVSLFATLPTLCLQCFKTNHAFNDQIILNTTRCIDFCFSFENLQIKMIYFLTARLGSWLYLTLHSKLFHLMTIYTQDPLSSFLMIGSRWSQIWFQVVFYYGGDLISQEINRNQACFTWILPLFLFNQL